MSTSKGSTPAAKASKGPAKLTAPQKDAIKKRKIEERKLPFAVSSSKYAPKARKATYVNAKKATKQAAGALRKVSTKKAAVKRPSKKQDEATKKRKAERDAKKSAKKQRVAGVDAYVKSLGKDMKAATKAWIKGGRKINRAVLETKTAPKPAGTKKVVVPRWGLSQRTHWRQLLKKGTRKPLSFGKIIAYAKAGNRIPLTRGERLRASQAKAKAHDDAQKKAGKGKAVALRGAAKRSASRFAKFQKKMAAKKAETAKRSEDKKKGLKVKSVKKTTTTARPIIRRKDKKIHIVNLDRVKRTLKKQYRARGNRQVLRASLKKGTVVIILRGKYAGRRAVFLKRLPVSGDLLVSGPFSVNGVPLYRISQNVVIATSTRVAVKGLPLAAKLTDKIFRATKFTPKKHTDEDFFAAERKTKNFPQLHRSQLQKTTDKFLEAEVNKTPLLAKYLQASFSLSDKDAPHAMVF